MFFVILSSLLPVFGIILMGFLAARYSLLPVSTAGHLNQYVYWIALPCMLFTQMALMEADKISGGLFLGLYLGLLAAYLPCFLLSWTANRKEPARATIAACVGTFPNVMFMAVPIISFLLPGDQEALSMATLAAMLYLPAMLYTDTALEMHRHKGEGLRQSLRSLGKALAHNPSVVAPGCGLAISLCGLTPPAVLTNMTGMPGNTAAPCALFAMGMVLHMQLSAVQSFPKGWLLQQLPVYLTKLLLMPLFTFIALRCFGVSGVPLGVATLCAGMPAGVAVNVLAEKYQVAIKDTALGICITTAASMAGLSLIIALMFVLEIF